MAYNQLADRFSSMSEQRDRNENSQTEAHCYMSEEGYVQEVVSKSPARIRDENGELHQIVTRRRTVTAGPSNTSSEAGGGWDTGSTSSPGGRNGGGGLQRAPSATGSAYTAPRLAYGQVALPSTPVTPDGGLYRGGGTAAGGGIAPAASSYNPPRSVSNYAANNNTATTPLRNGGSEYVPKYRFGGEHADDDEASSRNQNYISAIPSSTPNAGRVGGGTIRSPSFASPAPQNPGGGWGDDTVGTGASPSYFPAPYAASPVHEYQPQLQPQLQQHGSIAWVRNPNNNDAGGGGGENDEAPMSGGRYANYTSPLTAGPNSALRGRNDATNNDDNYTVITESRASLPGSRSSSVVNQHSSSGSVYRSGSNVYNNNNASRSVTITGVSGTTEIEPSRVSPIHVTTRYAPVKYVTRGELRRRQKEQEAIMNRRGQGMGGGGDNFASKIRYSSVPRLDSRMEEERISSGGNFYNNNNGHGHNQGPHSPATTWGGGGGGGAAPASSNRYYRGGAEEDGFVNQGPLPALSPGGSARHRSASNGPPRPYSSIPLDDDLESIASSAAGDQRRRQQQLMLSRQLAAQQQQLHQQRVFASEGRGGSDYYTNGGAPSQERPYYRAPSSNGNGGRSPLRRSNSMHGYNRLGVHQDANNDFIDIGDGTGSVYSAAPSYMPPNHRKNYGLTTTAFDLPETGVEAIHVARFLAHIRSIPADVVPPASQYVEAAFKLLTRGTYLIKYGRQGFPHERFFAVRMVPDERQFNGRTQPYLVWAVHGDSAVFKEKVHLGHLRGVTKGVASEGFTRSLVSPDIIDGPHVGQKKCTLPTTFAFSLIFKSSHAVRTVDLLALDDQTFRCWHLVFSYLAAVNNLDDGGAGGSTSGGPDGVESLVPDPDSPATYGTPPPQRSS